MSRKQCCDSTRSVSEGDLTTNFSTCVQHAGRESFPSQPQSDKKQFFSLPRWMSGRRKAKSKADCAKVTGCYGPLEDEENLVASTASADQGRSSFARKLFRKSSIFSKKHSQKNCPEPPTRVIRTSTISSSNTDLPCSNSVLCSADVNNYFKDKIPAVCGIRNHGNTCFINSVIQCLSNTDSFAEYFVRDLYKVDFHRRNKVHSKKYGTRGEVTVQLAVLLKSLWLSQCPTNISLKFKNLVAKYGSQYEGNEQHDAQEFLLWLLDKVHEDLNTAPKQKYKRSKVSLGHSDEEIAAQTLATHLRCNSSFVHDLFQGQIRSSLCCLGCSRFSNTFDPYLCLSLPIPQQQKVHLLLYLVYRNVDVKMIRVGLVFDSHSTVSDVFEKIALNFGLPHQSVFLTEMVDGDFKGTFHESDSITVLKDATSIYAIETPHQPINQSIPQEKICLVVSCCLKSSELENKMFWKPIAVEVDREICYKNIICQMLDCIKPVLKESFDLGSEIPFLLYIVSHNPPYEVLCSSVDMPLYMPIVDQELMCCGEKGPKYLKLILEWKPECKYLLSLDASFIEEHPSVGKVKSSEKTSQNVHLKECLDIYFNEEKLGVEDAWRCPWCQHRLPSIKQLSLWTVPDVLIVHLKRFRQSKDERIKLTTCVEFPTSGLDLQPYMAFRNSHNQQNSSNSYAFWSPWKRLRSYANAKADESTYDLYAVCNHRGNLQGGHYTAYCRNLINGRWYLFDDLKVQEIRANEVVSSDAYILFYQRSSLINSSCASSSSSGYSSASSNYSMGFDHWAFQLPFAYRDAHVASRSQDNLFDSGRTSSLDRAASRSFQRTSRSYSTMPHFGDEKWSSTIPRSIREMPSQETSYKEIEMPPPPVPIAKQYWTVTSV